MLTHGARPRVLLFGDSITQQSFARGGWGARLADAYARKARECDWEGIMITLVFVYWIGVKRGGLGAFFFIDRDFFSLLPTTHTHTRQADIINRGYSGYNTEWALSIAPEVLPPAAASAPPLAAVVLFFGANDAALADGRAARQHVPLPRFRANVVALVGAARAAGAQSVIVVTPPPVDEEGRARHAAAMFNEHGPPERTLASATEYAAAASEAASDAGADAVVDLCTALLREGDWTRFLSDGLHLTSEEGNAAVAAHVQAALVDVGLDPDNMALDFPTWNEFEQSKS